MDTRDFVALLATVCTVGLNLTGVTICLKIKRKGNTGDISFFPFLCMFCTSTLWAKYGLMKEDQTVIIVNCVGFVLNIYYMLFFYVYSIHKASVYKQVFLGFTVLFPALLYVRYLTSDHTTALLFMGTSASSLSVVAYGAPLASVSEVLRSRSTECMSFPLSVANFIVAIEWLAYGMIVGDKFIVVPNSLGLVLGFIQVSLFCCYASEKSSPGKASFGSKGAIVS